MEKTKTYCTSLNSGFMKKATILILTVFSFWQAFSMDIKQLEDSASFYYIKADYVNAAKFYDSIISKDFSSSELFLNAGNCYYQTGDLAQAIYFYEKSLCLNPSNSDAKHNLDIANGKIKSKTEELPVAFYNKWFVSIISIMSSDTWAIVSIILFILSLGLAGLYLFSKSISYRKTGFIIGVITLTFTILSIVFSINL